MRCFNLPGDTKRKGKWSRGGVSKKGRRPELVLEMPGLQEKPAVSGGDFLRINRQLLKIAQETYGHVGMFNPIGVASWNLRFKPLPYVELPVGLNEMEAIMKDKGRF